MSSRGSVPGAATVPEPGLPHHWHFARHQDPSSHPVLPNREIREGLSGEVTLRQDLREVQKNTCSAAVLMDLATRWHK